MDLIVDLLSKTLSFGPVPPTLCATVTGTLAFVKRGVPVRLTSGLGILIGVNSWINPSTTLLASAIPVRPAADGSPYTYSLSLNTAPLLALFTSGVLSYDCRIEVEWETAVGSGLYHKSSPRKMTVDVTAILSGSVAPVPLSAANDFFVASGDGLTVDINAGKLGGSIIAAQSGVVITNATNYVELDGSGVAAVNTTGWTDGYYPLAVVVASAGAITSNSDRRAWINGGSGGADITTENLLWVDKSGDDANDGSLAAPFLTLAAAKAAAVSGTTVMVAPGTYAVTASILKNGVNWHFEAGATVTKSITGAGPVGILDDGGAAITSIITGEGVFSTTSTSVELHGCVKTSHASSVVTVHARRITAAQTTGDGGYPSAVFGAAGSLTVECSESISASDPTETAFGLAVYWSNGSLYVRAPKIFATECAYYGDCTSTPTGDAFVSADDIYITGTGYANALPVINDASTNASAASWVVAKTIRSPVASIPSVSGVNTFAARLYVTAQKLFGSVQNVGTGLLYVNAEKIAATANGASGNPALVYSTGGTTRIACRHYDPASFTGQMIKVTGGTVYLRGGDFTGGASANGLEVTSGTVIAEGLRFNTSANSGTNAMAVSGGTLSLNQSVAVAHASGKDIAQSGGTVTVTGGSGSGTLGAFTTSGTVGYTKAPTALLADTATALATVRTIGGSNFDGTANVTSFPSPGAIGGGTPDTGAFTTLNSSAFSASANVQALRRQAVNLSAGNATITAGSNAVDITALSGDRTLTLPAANAVPAGFPIVIRDVSGSPSPTNNAAITRAGSDTIEPFSSTAWRLTKPYQSVTFTSDGTSKWTVQIPPIIGNAGQVELWTQNSFASGNYAGIILGGNAPTIYFNLDNNNVVLVNTTSLQLISVNFLAYSDNTNDIGASGANRFRDLWLARNASIGGTLAVTGASTLTGGITDATNIPLGTGTGTKIGTATGQKLAFWNATPVVQQVLATGAAATVDDVIALLQTLGLCKQS